MHFILSDRPQHAADFFRFILLIVFALVLLFWVASGLARAIDGAHVISFHAPYWHWIRYSWHFDYSSGQN